ncbi:MAG TPA: 30S ribosomal protein S15 [candidate division Zixibacteria bacterium]|nr:30S ribosomal protein S15 [bacterium]RLB77268.1 MAG: 30S ribosomal protein S15 [Deltaproteobacteria bacterium]HHH81314.1 30S ribosomal protein S15 [candidate division Zixibacteria bacterium]
MIDPERKRQIIKEFGRHEKDVGSPEVQVALLTERIRELTKHFERHPKDTNSKRGFMLLVGRRKRFLNYLRRKDYDRYLKLIKKLGLRK